MAMALVASIRDGLPLVLACKLLINGQTQIIDPSSGTRRRPDGSRDPVLSAIAQADPLIGALLCVAGVMVWIPNVRESGSGLTLVLSALSAINQRVRGDVLNPAINAALALVLWAAEILYRRRTRRS